MNRRFRALAQRLVVLHERRTELRVQEDAAVDALTEVVRAVNDVNDKLRALADEVRVVAGEECAAGRITDAHHDKLCAALKRLAPGPPGGTRSTASG